MRAKACSFFVKTMFFFMMAEADLVPSFFKEC